MKRMWIQAMIITLGGVGLAPASAADPDPDAADAILGYSLTAMDGTRVNVADLDTEVIVVTFWASWCKPCRKELPRLQALENRLGPDHIRVLAVSVDTDPAKAARFLRANDLSLNAFVDGTDGLARILDLEGLPYTFVLDGDRRLVHADGGADEKTLASLESAITRAGRGDGEFLSGRPR